MDKVTKLIIVLSILISGYFQLNVFLGSINYMHKLMLNEKNNNISFSEGVITLNENTIELPLSIKVLGFLILSTVLFSTLLDKKINHNTY